MFSGDLCLFISKIRNFNSVGASQFPDSASSLSFSMCALSLGWTGQGGGVSTQQNETSTFMLDGDRCVAVVDKDRACGDLPPTLEADAHRA